MTPYTQLTFITDILYYDCPQIQLYRGHDESKYILLLTDEHLQGYSYHDMINTVNSHVPSAHVLLEPSTQWLKFRISSAQCEAILECMKKRDYYLSIKDAAPAGNVFSILGPRIIDAMQQSTDISYVWVTYQHDSFEKSILFNQIPEEHLPAPDATF